MPRMSDEERRERKRQSAAKYRSTHREQRLAYGRAYYANNRERIRAVNRQERDPIKLRGWQLKRKYNLTYEQYLEMLEAQGGVCAICANTAARDLHVDHDHSCCPGQHSCGKCVRGLLCARCNPALGAFNDDRSTLAKAIAYLERHVAA